MRIHNMMRIIIDRNDDRYMHANIDLERYVYK